MNPEDTAVAIQKLIDTLHTNYDKKDQSLLALLKFLYSSTVECVSFIEKTLGDMRGMGSTKKAFVIETITALYNKINPDLPWIVEPFESLVEKLILKYVIPSFIDVVVMIFNKYGIFTK